ncbi:MAG: beta-galactosidase [Actinomycetota bacterium]
MPAEAAPFRLGVNYWPARTAMHWWHRFDPEEVSRDFQLMRSARMDSVRLFLRWEDFQPAPGDVDREMLERLVGVADIAERAGMSIMPTLFTGHMSGVNWLPGWALGGPTPEARFRIVSAGAVVEGGASRHWFTDPEVGAAQALLASEAANALRGHPALLAWDLGNENSNVIRSLDHDPARRWLWDMTSGIHRSDPDVPITIGLHMEDLEEDRGIGPAEAAEVCDFITMHGYPIYARWARGATDEHLVPFLAHISRWLSDGADVWFTEFGLPTRTEDDADPRLVEEESAARYTAQVLDGLREAGCMGAMVWCFADYDPANWSAPPLDDAMHERSFGLWRADGSEKPAVGEIATRAGQPRLSAPDDTWIDIDPASYWARPDVELPRLYERYVTR